MKKTASGSAKTTAGIKARSVLAVLFGVVSIVLFGIFLERIQVRYTMEDIRKEMAENAEYLKEIFLSRHEVYLSTRKSFRELYEQDLYLLEYLMKNDPDFVLTQDYLKELNDRLELKDLMVADRKGEILISASGSRISLKSQRYTPLRECFNEGGVTEFSALSEEQAWEMANAGEEEDPDSRIVPDSAFYAYAVSDELAFVIETE